jgi:hypothetical protein
MKRKKNKLKTNTEYVEYKYILEKVLKTHDVDPDCGVCLEPMPPKNDVIICSFASAFAFFSMFQPLKSISLLNRDFGVIPTSYDASMLACLSAEHRAMRGRATHYFLETEFLADFCVKATPIFTIDMLKPFLESGSDRNVKEAIFHTKKEAVLFRYFNIEDHTKPFITISDGFDTGSFFVEGNILERLEKPNLKRMVRFVFGMCLYMNCFPSAVRDGVPDGVPLRDGKTLNHGKSITIKAHTDIIKNGGPKPHFRSGHFRLLSSPKFKNKQGQVIFVRSTYVKGEPKIVDDVIS